MLQCSATYKKFQRKVRKRLFTANDEEQFMNELAMFDWSNITTMMIQICSTHILRQRWANWSTNTSRWKQYEWIIIPFETLGLHQELLKVLKEKNELYRAKLKNPTPKNTQNFRHYRNKLNHLIRFTKKNYYKSKLDKAQGDMRAQYFENHKWNFKQKEVTTGAHIKYCTQW